MDRFFSSKFVDFENAWVGGKERDFGIEGKGREEIGQKSRL